jgi:hypothetical protein
MNQDDWKKLSRVQECQVFASLIIDAIVCIGPDCGNDNVLGERTLEDINTDDVFN